VEQTSNLPALCSQYTSIICFFPVQNKRIEKNAEYLSILIIGKVSCVKKMYKNDVE
jgi:hypothetical protein